MGEVPYYLREGTSGKEHNEENDDKNNHADKDNHLHILPPEFPSHLLRCRLEMLRCGFQILCLVTEMFQVFPSGQDPLHILGHNILNSLHLTLQVPNAIISSTFTGFLDSAGALRPAAQLLTRREAEPREANFPGGFCSDAAAVTHLPPAQSNGGVCPVRADFAQLR